MSTMIDEFKLSPQATDLTGRTFGRLTAIKPIAKDPKNNVIWRFKCLCGNNYESVGAWVVYQHKKATNPSAPSCGCLNKETTAELRYKHGMSNHPLFWVWAAMLDRCYNPNNRKYPIYGGNNVYVCEEWKNDSSSFINWALNNGWEKGKFLDKDILCKKLNLPKHYSPQTCQFVSSYESATCNDRHTDYYK